MEKKNLRTEMKKLRSALSQTECNTFGNSIYLKIHELKDYKDANNLLIYMHFKNEVPTDQIILHALQDHKHVFVPRVEGQIMQFYEIKSLNDCTPGCMGILEPSDLSTKYDYKDSNKAFMIVPGLAFDLSGNRLGYGGGFYDKYLEDKTTIKKCAISYDFQIVPKVETHEKDIKMNLLITEKRIIHYD